MKSRTNRILSALIVISLIAAFCSGVYGYCADMGLKFDDATYKTLILYVLGGDTSDIPIHSLYINIARFLAPFSFIAGGAQIIQYLSNDGFTRLKWQLYRNHYVIFGNGAEVQYMIEALISKMRTEGKRYPIIVVGNIQNLPGIDIVRIDSLSELGLSNLHLTKAKEVIILMNEELHSLNTVDAIYRHYRPDNSDMNIGNPRRDKLPISILMCCNSDEIEGVAQEIYKNKFNRFATFKIAEEMINSLPVFNQKTIVILGLGEIGRRIVGKYKDANQIIGYDSDTNKVEFLNRANRTNPRMQFRQKRMEDINPLDEKLPNKELVFFVCGGNDIFRFRIAIKWKQYLPECTGIAITNTIPSDFMVLKRRDIITLNYRKTALYTILYKPDDILISVIIPAYNASEHLRQCLDSLRGQQMRRLEFILVNDGSTDQTLEIMKHYSNQDNRFKIIDIPHSGVGEARNKGVCMATGRYIAFMDADDVVKPDIYEILYRSAIESNADITICRAGSIDCDGKAGKAITCWNFQPGIYDTERIMNTDFLNNICSPVLWDKLIKSPIAKKCLSPTLDRGQDFIALISMIHESKKIRIITDELYCYRHHDKSNMAKPISETTINEDIRTEHEAIRLIARYWKGSTLSKEYIRRTAGQWSALRERLKSQPQLTRIIDENLPAELKIQY